MKIFPMFIVMLVILLPAMFWRAFVASYLWTWFATPMFNLQTPKLAVIVGLILLIELVWPWRRMSKKAITWEDFSKATTRAVAIPLTALAAGWIVKTFFM